MGTSMKRMFKDAKNFNGKIGQWDVSSVTDMTSMLNGAENFDQDLGSWKTSSLKEMDYMFRNASNFTGQGLEKWNLKKLTDVRYAFGKSGVRDETILKKFKL